MFKKSGPARAFFALSIGILLTAAVAIEQESPQVLLAPADFDRFAPSPRNIDTSIDYAAWDDALEWFVLSMGVSLREAAPQRSPSVGSRFLYGHNSIYRMEGNRVAFSFLKEEQLRGLTEYRQDLERVGSTLGLAELSRNEQLAFWINLHNVAIIEQIALAYPVSSPAKVKIAGVPLDNARFITVSGVRMSPKDIRTQIVYRHWRNPDVIYGFFRGDIGGPSIQRQAYNGRNVSALLARSANEFVNALRGVSGGGRTLRVSEIYEEARPYFFLDWPHALRAHLARHAEEDVAGLLAKAVDVEASIREIDLADLSKGEREPLTTEEKENCYFDIQGYACEYQDITVPLAIQRFVDERNEKVAKLIREGRAGRVIIAQGGKVLTPEEVE